MRSIPFRGAFGFRQAYNDACVHAAAAFAARDPLEEHPGREHCWPLFPPCFDAMLRSVGGTGEASIDLARGTVHCTSISTIPQTEAVCCCKTAAAFRFAQFWLKERNPGTAHEQWSGSLLFCLCLGQSPRACTNPPPLSACSRATLSVSAVFDEMFGVGSLCACPSTAPPPVANRVPVA